MIHFPIRDLLPLLTHSENAPEQGVTFQHLVDPTCWKPNATVIHGLRVDAKDVDKTKIPPSLILVKDQGCYFMSNGQPELPGTTSRNHVVYGNETGPDDYESTRRLCGGDDFAELIDCKTIREILNDPKNAKATHIVVIFKPDTFEFYTVTR